MPWYHIHYESLNQIRFYASIDAAYLDHFAQEKWSTRIKKCNIKPLNSKYLERFLIEVLKGLEAGLTLQDVLGYIGNQGQKSNLALVAQGIKGELSNGTHFNQCFKQLIDKSLIGYCDLFLEQSTAEQLLSHLSILYSQIYQLRSWIKRIQKSLVYPFFVVQFSLLIWLTSQLFDVKSTFEQFEVTFIYTMITLVQLGILFFLQSGLAIALIERYLSAFRLNKLFNLLNASLSTGNHLQNALMVLPTNFNNKQIKQELLLVYYHLRLGDSYLESFPSYWFPKESLLALEASCHTGNILRAIESAAHIHKQRWQRTLKLIETICPLIGLIVAGIFVTKALISIYLPLLNMN